MSRLSVLVFKEVLGPWVFGVAIFSALILTITYLFKVTEYLAQGIDPFTVLTMTFLFLPGIFAKTFAMAVLLASLLAFGRLSGDSEIVALRASGTSLGKVMVPVGVFGLAVALASFVLNETVVPAATMKAESMRNDIAKQLNSNQIRPVGHPIFEKGELVAQLNARDFDLSTQTLRGVNIVVFRKGKMDVAFYADAEEMVFTNDKEWRIKGKVNLITADGSSRVQLEDGMWPKEVPRLNRKPEDLLAASVRNLDSFSMKQFQEQIRQAKQDQVNDRQIANLEYGYYNKMALPLAAFVFGLVGAPMGIRNHRTGTAAGYMMAVLIIFGYFVLSNIMAVYAQGRAVSPALASFLPVLIGTVLAVVTIHRKNN